MFWLLFDFCITFGIFHPLQFRSIKYNFNSFPFQIVTFETYTDFESENRLCSPTLWKYRVYVFNKVKHQTQITCLMKLFTLLSLLYWCSVKRKIYLKLIKNWKKNTKNNEHKQYSFFIYLLLKCEVVWNDIVYVCCSIHIVPIQFCVPSAFDVCYAFFHLLTKIKQFWGIN